MIKKDTWVQIKKVILKSEERAGNLPEETKKVPLIMWVKGFLLKEAELNDEVQIKTLTGRIESGTLIEVNPAYMHTYGKFMPEILRIDDIVKSTLFGDDHHE
ncbi:MAG: 2-amino-4-oxopentanoate thiolase subunit OrtA [Candidatus Izemoplasmatales bacterium]|uniref:2-amino-4-ketopentanoate thiolase n=1 Tax=Hujiaoplasma nucleasis TaxID=2725268 RepID=A0A7L6MZB8_9MOLU|nr:2-amino-4-oxopentanoate thiolase subunit OrtA [Hujiaoplasma nucleasis]QLY39330.1 2-amino-4-ketopentanoate thiolase [Hujiaoplasma nucleasis]